MGGEVRANVRKVWFRLRCVILWVKSDSKRSQVMVFLRIVKNDDMANFFQRFGAFFIYILHE